jgi:mono/diheme cytochrome c family protein
MDKNLKEDTRMKKIHITALISYIAITVMVSSCGGNRNPARTYMPDMGPSRAYETYAMHDTVLFTTESKMRGGNIIFYNSMPVPGTIKRGELYPYTISNDSIGYKLSASVVSPLTDTLDMASLAEAGRLYNINCGICHGDKAGGNGPLATSGQIGAVANLASGEKAALSDGTMFHVITYGKGQMGSYAAQLNSKQRWEVIQYIRSLQKGGTTTTSDSSAAKKSTDSAAVAK